MKLTNQLLSKHGDTLDDKSLTICSGTDYINVNYQHLVCPDAATAKVKALFIILKIKLLGKKLFFKSEFVYTWCYL